jgi:hypothetical protein
LRSRAQERRGFSSGGAVGFCAVLYWTGRWRLLVVSLRRKVEACSLCVFLRRDGEGEVVRLDPAQHPLPHYLLHNIPLTSDRRSPLQTAHCTLARGCCRRAAERWRHWTGPRGAAVVGLVSTYPCSANLSRVFANLLARLCYAYCLMTAGGSSLHFTLLPYSSPSSLHSSTNDNDNDKVMVVVQLNRT